MSNSYDLKNKKILLTGANGRLGKAYTYALLKNGAFVYITDLQDEISPELKEKLGRENLVNYKYIRMDVSSEESILQTKDAIKDDMDVLINNAGKGFKTPFEERTPQEIELTFNVHVKGTILCSKIFSKKMVEKKHGKIINIGSIYGVMPPDKRIYADKYSVNSEIYGASKAGIIQFTKYLAAYFGEFGITVNCVSPGGVHHDGQNPFFVKNYIKKTPLGRMANTEDLANVICFLASDDSNYITGQNIIVDGGFTLNQ